MGSSSKKNEKEKATVEPTTPKNKPEKAKEPKTTESIIQKKNLEIDQTSVESNRDKLFLRQFYINEQRRSDKVITKLNNKVYFPKDPSIEPGWYVASIVEERETYGVMDTLPVEKVPVNVWFQKLVKGVFVHKNYNNNCVEIYKAIPRERLETEESIPIHVIPIKFQARYDASNSIGEILKSKKIESPKKS